MTYSFKEYVRFRKSFAKIPKIAEIPDLVEVQKKSYEIFLKSCTSGSSKEDIGLNGVFKSVFPIKSFDGTASLEFVSYSLGEPKYTVEECRQKGVTYAAPTKVAIRLEIYDILQDNTRAIKNIKEQEVYFGEIPLMTETGSFVINGTERVIVSQLQRSPGVFFEHDKAKSATSSKLLHTARVIPYRGSWLDFEFDAKDILYVRIDKRRKMPASILLRALGNTEEELLNYFYNSEVFVIKSSEILKKFNPEVLSGKRAVKDITDPKTKAVIVKKNNKISKTAIEKIKNAGIELLPSDLTELLGKYSSTTVVDTKTGEIILECNKEITEDVFKELVRRKIPEIKVLYIDPIYTGTSIRDTLLADKVETTDAALIEIYKRLRPGDPPTLDAAKNLFENLFFNPERYDLSSVGRLKLNYKLGRKVPLDVAVLQKGDILEVVRYLINLKNGIGTIDDIDHLGNRRVRSVGELVENQFRIGLVRMERAIKERMSLHDVETLMPHDLINPKPVSAVIKEFFGSSQLSQFMDQTNPLSEITHKRRLSALGPGGLSRERAGFEVRDVHPTHYGRICPIETPEGPNIGLISSLSTYARVNQFGFIETPYRIVKAGAVTNQIGYFSALDEEKYTIAQANAQIDSHGKFLTNLVSARKGGEFILARPEEIELMDVSPNQLVSVAASLIPFLEHDDANRALMGSNMQRQAVPLLRTESPLVGTGIEAVVARDAGVTVIARKSGIVESVDATKIVIRAYEESEEDISSSLDVYNLIKFQKSNQNTCINQKPLVRKRDKVNKGEIIADGPSTENGELALGRNILVAFMPWCGYNFEDSILVNENLLKSDVFTSIHIEEFECAARETKAGKEDITRDIPNVGEEHLRNLDENGIVRVGAEVITGDILVGKVTPKTETQLSPEDKLLRAIFGEKAGDVKDSSLRVEPGVEGIVIDTRIFSRKSSEKTEKNRFEEKEEERIKKDREDEISIINDNAARKIRKILLGKSAKENLAVDKKGGVTVKKGEKLSEKLLDKIPLHLLKSINVAEDKDAVSQKISKILENASEQVHLIDTIFSEKLNRLRKGDELPPGVTKLVKVYVAIKRKLAVGDKMAGRHGNKGVLSKIVATEDMPFLENGTPVDMVLNPLGVPSRMNVGQILETHLGWAAKGLGERIDEYIKENFNESSAKKYLKNIYDSKDISRFIDSLTFDEIKRVLKNLRKGIHLSTPVFDGADETEIRDMLDKAGLPATGQTRLKDGRTGELFEQEVTVGMMYMLKLHHLVDDKIHARSTGPYSLVTQQPLGGKAQFGGQRLGEMEVWAMEAYGASYSLQEFLTVKSDDVAGRARMYEAIVKGRNLLEPGMPESFNVLIKELQSLGLDVNLREEEE